MKKKEINIHPSEWCLDVWVGKFDRSKFRKHYQLDVGELTDEMNCVGMVSIAYDPKRKENKIFMWLREVKPEIVAHEIIHVLWRLNGMAGFEMNAGSQEWQALLTEYLFKNIVDSRGYKKVK